MILLCFMGTSSHLSFIIYHHAGECSYLPSKTQGWGEVCSVGCFRLQRLTVEGELIYAQERDRCRQNKDRCSSCICWKRVKIKVILWEVPVKWYRHDFQVHIGPRLVWQALFYLLRALRCGRKKGKKDGRKVKRKVRRKSFEERSAIK